METAPEAVVDGEVHRLKKVHKDILDIKERQIEKLLDKIQVLPRQDDETPVEPKKSWIQRLWSR